MDDKKCPHCGCGDYVTADDEWFVCPNCTSTWKHNDPYLVREDGHPRAGTSRIEWPAGDGE